MQNGKETKQYQVEVLCEPLINAAMAAKLLDCSPWHIKKLAAKMEIPAVPIGNRWKFRASEIDKWAKAKNRRQKRSHAVSASNPKLRQQQGTIELRTRKRSTPSWWFRFYEKRGNQTVRRSVYVGTTEEYPTKELAWAGAISLRKRCSDPDSIYQQGSTGVANDRFSYSFDEYQRQLIKQLGKCSICGDEPNRLHWDHDHATGKPRELLCQQCNRAIGMLRDSSARCEKAAAYLRRFGK